MSARNSIWASKAEYTVTLPCGVVVDGKIHRDVVLTPFTVADRKSLGEKDVQRNPARMTTRILKNKIKSIGDIESVSEDLIRKMMSFDRDYLLYQIRDNATKSGCSYEYVWQ
jgi:hypothetical protein